jgi:hypothetical protein
VFIDRIATLSHLFEYLEFLVFKLFVISSMVIYASLILRPHWKTLFRPKTKPKTRRGIRPRPSFTPAKLKPGRSDHIAATASTSDPEMGRLMQKPIRRMT